MTIELAEPLRLLHAIEAMDETAIEAILSGISDPHACERAIVTAAWQGNTALVRRLLDAGVPAESCGINDQTVLSVAAAHGDAEMIALLLAHGANPLQIRDLGSPLHRAASSGNTDTVRALLDAGVPPDILDRDKNTPLHRVSWVTFLRPDQTDTTGPTRLLLEYGANPNAINRYETRPLHEVAQRGADSILILLLKAGAEVNAVTKRGKKAALHFGAEAGHRGVVEQLLNAGATINQPAMDNKTPLFYAAWMGHLSVIELLLTSGADPTIATVRGVTPAAIAKKSRHHEVYLRLQEAERLLKSDRGTK